MIFIRTFLLLLFQHLFLSSAFAVSGSRHHRNHSLLADEAALLAFKKTIVFDPESKLAGWTEGGDVCSFTGVRCDKHRHSVVQLNLSRSRLTGALSPIISNLSGLRYLILDENHFYGIIPPEFSSLRHLQSLRLDSNNLRGSFPEFLAALPNLTVLTLTENHLMGTLPPSLFSNCSSLANIELSQNLLTGKIPQEIGNCLSLWNLNLYNNQFTGELPATLGNISELYNIDVESNSLTGELPANIIGKLYSVVSLHLSYNKMVSHDHNTNLEPFFTALANCTELQELELAGMRLGGRLPSSIGRLSGELSTMLLQENSIFGTIPPDIAHLSSLTWLNLTSNSLNGTIPAEISRLSYLEQLFLSHNLLTGAIPAALGQLPHLGLIDLSNNQLSGEIPASLGNLVRLSFMFLNNNLLTGTIPPTLGKCTDLSMLDLSYNRLTGSIPPEISGNHLSGGIPTSLNKSQSLSFLNLSFNDFAGVIPSGGVFNSVTDKSFLGNQDLCGAVSGMPKCSHKSQWFRLRLFLIVFVLVTFASAILITICCVIGIRRIKVMVSSGNSVDTEQARKPETPELIHNFPRITYRELSEATGGFDEQRLVGTGSYGRVYKGLLPDGTAIAVKVLQFQSGNSTKSFNRECQVLKRIRHRNLIRIITACSLPDFKALVLPYMANGSLDSRLYPHSETDLGSGSSDLTLLQRVSICCDIAEGMAYLHHHSPVKVIHCDLKPSNVLLNDDMTALVSDFGIARLVMTVGGGNGGVVENMGNSTANLLCGSIGYVAPEYGFGSTTSTKGDVYSFGVLVLEMVTRKRPTDDMFVGGLNLHKWVKTHYHGRLEKVVDPYLMRASRDQFPEVKRMWEVAIGELVELGILCTQESPSTRPTMLDAADDLDRLKRYLSGDTTATFASSLGISSSTLGDD
ncbi:PREDICTED: putative leucine-rich repeat receptor-like serine/threonine-protein kinase At2g24130 isoform X3 [Populus euphratica]|uniref:non-specific serine/threonine protein kinase n=1 Tax=Populus euphratica TaxID=75702 RepID=A0AAJ6XXD8_POPEU|nr:PREDICTED: putative leucine-rich repeat receptor-like serine/threonine-protein kinase At2g24130 isoform X3 [Populus euphratica]